MIITVTSNEPFGAWTTTSSTICATTCSGWHKRKHHSSRSLTFCKRNPQVACAPPSQIAKGAEIVSIAWRHHDLFLISLVYLFLNAFPDRKVRGANMGPTWALSAPDGPHAGAMNLAIRVFIAGNNIIQSCTAAFQHVRVFFSYALTKAVVDDLTTYGAISIVMLLLS